MSEQESRRVRRTEAEVAANLPALLDAVAEGTSRVVVTRDGKPIAAIITAWDLVRLQNLDEQSHRDFTIFRRIGEAFKGVPLDQLEREVAKAVAEARAELRAEREAATQQAAHSA